MSNLLKRISGPEDLKGLSMDELETLAGLIREEIIQTISSTGGHLAPSLGAVELTIALHRFFDSPVDKIVWDIGHQAYAHKILTGRLERFHTIRQTGGISGFLKRKESIHDVWEAGHASTAISAALGMAKARDLQGEDYKVVAVIGDGAMTAGVAFEALNNAGHSKNDLMVVLNDNSMSISKNVGALSIYLGQLRSDPTYSRMRNDISSLVRKIPRFGDAMANTADKIKDSFKYLVIPGMLFEELGFKYFGPIDGHNLADLESVLNSASKVKGPVLVHVITHKGKGYKYAEADAANFHGPGPFDIVSGKIVKKPAAPSYSSVFGSALVDLAKEDQNITAITAAMPDGTGLSAFQKEFPDRFFDVGIAEQHAVTFAGGLASSGLKPVVAIYSSFLQRAYDQVLHDIALQNLPVVFALDRAGIVGADGETHHGIYDFAYLRNIPNMVIMAPKDENELRDMLKTAVLHDGPISLRYPRGSSQGLEPKKVEPLEIGKAEVLKEGKDITLVAIGSMVYKALEAAEILKEKGIRATVINARFVKPLDIETISHWAKKTGKVLTIEEHVKMGGFGSAVLEALSAQKISASTRVLALPDEIIEHGDTEELLHMQDLDAEGIVKQAMELLYSAGNKKWFRGSTKAAEK